MILQIINIASGVVGASSYIKDTITHTAVHGALDTIRPYESRLGVFTAVFGLIAIACGLGSLLFGCALPLVCRAPFGI